MGRFCRCDKIQKILSEAPENDDADVTWTGRDPERHEHELQVQFTLFAVLEKFMHYLPKYIHEESK
jgi:hypothetical protein